jgi:HAE1 family hydrophobic/amphiphilic exporter-1
MANFFLQRPVFAWVIAISMMLAGGLAIYNLPISQYPPVAPPSIAVTAYYPGASAQTVEESVVQIIEQKLTGLDRMLYMSSTSDSSGAGEITLTFAPGTDPDLAWSKVQNKLQLALPSLPEVVQRQGVTVSKSTRNYLLLVGLTSPEGTLTQDDLMDYLSSQVESVLARVPGVGEVEVFGSQYAMRLWLDPDLLMKYDMTIEDVITAVSTYNVQVSAGQFGGTPAVAGQRLNASILVQSLLETPEAFEAILLRTYPDGSVVRLEDVGRAELASERSGVAVEYNGQPAGGLAIRQEPGANALDTADAVKAKMEELSKYFPPDMQVVYPYDTTPFVRVAIDEVVKTLFEATLLVFLVMYLFLGNIRATLIPTIAVPVVILGTFGVLGAFGFSINMLTMFAMVLSIGLLVDDAIVVVENVERVMTEENLPPREATRKSMKEITSALVGIGLVLSAVFGPMIFFPGSTGVIYRQFSVTVIASMMLSVVVAIVLTPVLCAALLKPHAHAEHGRTSPLRAFFLRFERAFSASRNSYVAMVGKILVQRVRWIAVFVLLIALAGFLFVRMPTAYLPNEDQGLLLTSVELPVGSTLEQTNEVMESIRDYFLKEENATIESIMTASGFGFAGQGQNQGIAFMMLKDWDERQAPELSAGAIAGRAMGFFSTLKNARSFAFPPPAIIELGTSNGFDFMLQDRSGVGHEALMDARMQVLGMAMNDPRLVAVRPNGLPDQPQYQVELDWEKAGALGVPVSSAHMQLASSFGSAYINDFIHNGRVKRVYAQFDAPHRMLPEDLESLYIRNAAGDMVPFSAITSTYWTHGSPRLERYNGFPSLNFLGEAAPGYSSGEAMQAMEEIVEQLPPGFGYEWTGMSYQERMAESQAGLLYAFSVLVIFLVLAALYENWTIPISVMMALPLGVIGSLAATTLRGLPNDVYFQIGLLTVLGLTTKNAILIAQFAMQHLDQGMELIEATLKAARQRLRPIIMTSLAFGFGVLPLVVASGAGAGAMNAIGTAVFGGMVTATFLAIFFIPLFFVIVTQLFSRNAGEKPRVLSPEKEEV